MPEYHLRIDGQSMPFTDSILLMDALRARPVSFPMPCGGRGICGKCVVWVKGRFSDLGEAEASFLQSANLPEKEGFALRLACMCRLLGDGEVLLPKTHISAVSDAMGSLPAYDGDRPDSVGLAVDIGTTTVALRLYALQNGKLLSSVVEMNDQARFGADVLSRIGHSSAHGVKTLQSALLSQLSRMMEGALLQASRGRHCVERAVFVGNTTMLHFLKGLDPEGIGVSPFRPQSLFGETFGAKDLFSVLSEDTEAYIPRCVSAYVGADVSAGMLAAGFDRPLKKLLVDVGTNGEMALRNEGGIVCCATAAGPAFEGAQISMGMPATDGAIYAVAASPGGVHCQTIGNAAPRGLCGTGIISLLSMLRKERVLEETGLLHEAGERYGRYIREVDGQRAFMVGDSGVSLSMRDIRQVQLAKAAIAAGIETLLHEEALSAGDLAEFLLAGGFGSRMRASDAADIGLIPRACVRRTRAIGNAALHGASAMLFSKAHRKTTDQIVQSAVEKPLSSHPYFMERYVENMMFPEAD